MNPKITVVIPCYNYGRFLKRSVDSVLNQTYQDFEIIIVDDCSTDNTTKVASEYFFNPKVRYIEQPNNVGQSKNRNTGIRASKGEFIAFIDADDWVEPQYLESLILPFSDSEVGATYALKKLFYPNRVINEQGRIVNGYAYNELFVSNFIGTPVMFRKEAILERGYETNLSPHLNNLGVDWWILLDLSTRYIIIGINKHLYNYNHHGNSISNNNLRRIEADRIIQRRFLKEHPNLLSKKSVKEASYWQFFREGLYYRLSNKKWTACLSFLKSIIIRPLYLNPYKSLIYTLIQR